MRASWKRIAALAAVVALMFGPSCSSLEGPGEITALRVIAVTIDPPYAVPGAEVSLRLTYHDGFGPTPRPIQVTWIAGCLSPPGLPYYICYPQLEKQFAQLGGDDPSGPFLQQEVAPPELSGEPDAVSFSVTLPKDLFGKDKGDKGDEGGGAPFPEGELPAIAGYVFFTLCAGTVGPEGPGSDAKFPLGCFDESGERVGPHGFVIGYTEVTISLDGKYSNFNPPVDGLSLDGRPLPSGSDEPWVLPRCDEISGGCGTTTCEETYELEAIVEDVAELDPAATEAQGTPQREALWINYYTDRGSFPEDGDEVILSGSTTGYKEDHFVTWVPPAQPGLVSIWAVVHDSRGGATVVRRFVLVE